MFQADIFNKMTLHAKKSLTEAGFLALHYENEKIEPIHLLFAIYLEEGSLGSNILNGLGIKKSHFKSILTPKSKEISSKINKNDHPLPSEQLKKIITQAYSLASSFSYPYIGTEHLAYALIESKNESIENVIQKSSRKKYGSETISRLALGEDILSEFASSLSLPDIKLSKNKNGHIGDTEYLKQFCLNLNEESEKDGEIISGRNEETERLIHILGRKTKNNPLIIGDPGVGKTALVSGLAKRITAGDVPYYLTDKTIFSLDMALVVAGTTFRGEFENRLKEIINEAEKNKNVILFIDEIHTIVGAGNSQGGLDAANILKPSLSKGNIQCIGATTYSEHKKYIEKDPALARRFQPIRLQEPSIKNAKMILNKLKPQYERFHNVTITNDAIDSAVDLSIKYINDRFLPDKSIDLLDEAASAIKNKSTSLAYAKKLKQYELTRKEISANKEKLVQQQKYEEAMNLQKKESVLSEKISALKNKQAKNKRPPLPLTSVDIVTTISKMTGIPKEKISAGQTVSRISDIETKLNADISGQKKAIKTIANVLLRSYGGITNPDRPMGSFLFMGPTGVGKTLTAKMIAKEIFSNENPIIKIDMSEFSEKHMISRLTGAPAGYVGFGEGGILTEKVRHRPYSLVLFDEIEKAHPDILNILLQILEDGTLTDAEGRNVDFKNTVVILTSNIGSSEFTESAKLGFSEKNIRNKIETDFDRIKNDVIKKLSEKIKPEILNRLDQVIVFDALSEKDIADIVSGEMKILRQRLKKQGISLKYQKRVGAFIAQKSNVTEYGGRLARKNIQDLLETEIAKIIISNPNKKTINISIKNGKIIAK